MLANVGCYYDDTWTFRAGGTYVREDGPTKCNPRDPAQVIGYWEFSADETRIGWKADNGADRPPYGLGVGYALTTVSKNQLVMEEPASPGVKFVIEFTPR